MHETPRRTAATPRAHPLTAGSTSVPLPSEDPGELSSGSGQGWNTRNPKHWTGGDARGMPGARGKVRMRSGQGWNTRNPKH